MLWVSGASSNVALLAVVLGHNVVSGRLVAAVLPVVVPTVMMATEVFRKLIGLTVI